MEKVKFFSLKTKMLTDVAPSKDSSKLAIAAEELIKAACSHVKTTSLTIGRGTVEELKKLSLNSESVLQSVVAVKGSFDSKLNTISMTKNIFHPAFRIM